MKEETNIRMHELLGMIGELHERVSELELKLAKKTTSRFQKPTTEEVAAYSKEIKAGIDAQQFCDFYESKGWKIGNTPMKDWKATVRTWKRKNGGNTIEHVGQWPAGFQPLFPGHRPDK